MNIVRISRLLKSSALLISFIGTNILLSACGGGSDVNKNGPHYSTSSSSVSSSSHMFSSTPITPAGSGTWPDVKVSAAGTKTLMFDWTAAPNATSYKLFKKVDSNSSYVQVGSDFTGIHISDAVSVHLTDWVNMRYKVQACDSNSVCVDSTEIVANSAMLSSIAYVKASNTKANDWFGWSVAISADGNTMAVGAPGESSIAKGVNGNQTVTDDPLTQSPTSGAVYVFIKVNGNWQQEAYLKASNTEQPTTSTHLQNTGDRFGYQVALSSDGNTLAVSAINEDSPSKNVNCLDNDFEYSSAISSTASSSSSIALYHTNLNMGAVYIFKRDSGNWSQVAYVKPLLNEQSAQLQFGSALALSGDGKTLAVGSIYSGAEIAGFTGIHAVPAPYNTECIDYVALALASSSSSSSSSTSSSSSSSVSSSSSTSSSSSSIAGGKNSGAVYLYKLTTDGWISDTFIKPNESGINYYFGASIALSQDGNWLVAGATGDNRLDSAGAIATVTVTGTVEYLTDGAVFVYSRDVNGLWAQQSKIKSTTGTWAQQFGYSVAISGDAATVAVGSPTEWGTASGINGDATLGDITSFGTGAAYVFTISGSTWSQQAYIKASNPTVKYNFGSAVSLSTDGNILAVGSLVESSQATGINGDQLDQSMPQAGAAYLFLRSNTTWTQKSYVKAPKTYSLARIGRTLALDGNGDTLMLGAYRDASNATGLNGDQTNTSAAESGAVYLY